MKKHLIAAPLLLLLSFTAHAQHYELPSVSVDRNRQLLTHMGYTSLYDDVTKQPVWVAWDLTPEETKGSVSRTDEFTQDPSIAFPHPPQSSDYTRSGFDRGHMAPAADFRWSLKAMEESFYIGANICPQDHTLNEKTWCDLEKACRFWANRNTLYIACGPLFPESPQRIGASGVAVPSAFWKVILRETSKGFLAIGFVFPNKALSDDFHRYAVSVDDVEKLTGLDFFHDLPDTVEKVVEASFDISRWNYDINYKK